MWRVLQAGEPPAPPPPPARPRIGLCRTPFWSAAAPEAREAFKLAGQRLAAGGCELEELELPASFESLIETHKFVLDYEAARTWAYEWEPPRRDKLSKPLRAMVERGWTLKPADYLDHRRVMARARLEFTSIASRYDAVMAPSAPGEAPAGLAATGDPIFNRIWTLLHVPTFTLTVSKGPHGLPVGVQFISVIDGDLALLSLGKRLAECLA
jgi:Asp-tRNA(Asn)/Glu-tRNA(Gln) amidotransferase A subunit family amidase